MNAFAKVLVVVVLLLSAAYAGSQMMLHSKRVNWREKYETAAADLKTKAQTAAQLGEELKTTVRDCEGMKARKEAEIARLQDETVSKDLEIVRLNRERENLQDTWNAERIRVNKLEDRLVVKDELIGLLRLQVQALGEDLMKYMAGVEQLEGVAREKELAMKSLDDQVAQLEKEKQEVIQERDDYELVLVELARRGFHIPPSDVPAIDAKVARVDNELGAVVFNKGKQDRVKVNFPFTIYRGTDFVARAYVMEVYDGHSLARVDRALEHLPVEVGDDATTRVH